MHTAKIKKVLFYLPLLLLILSGCTVRYVADYNAEIKDETLQIAKKVDLFWGTLIDTQKSKRKYHDFKDKYIEIETDIRILNVKNKIRAFNKTSTKQVNVLLELWLEDKKSHKNNNSFSGFIATRHRKQFLRLFTAIAKGEEEKNISSVAK